MRLIAFLSCRAPLLRDQTGSELIEYSLASSVLLLVIFGIMDCSRALYSYHYVAQAARQATRFASVRGATWGGASCSTYAYHCTATAADVLSYVNSITPLGFGASNLTVATIWPGTNVNGLPCSLLSINNSPGCLVTVKVSYNFSFVLPFLPQSALSLTSTSKMMISQ
jgi:Flp pilus assembly protein TadG